MSKSDHLTAKQEMFCRHYASVDSATYGKKFDSAIAAGYAEKSAAEMAGRLTNNNPLSMALIEKIYSENARKNKGRLLSHLEYNRKGAVKAGKWDAANTSCKLQAQIFGFLFESQDGIVELERRKISAKDSETADMFAELSLKYPDTSVSELLRRLLDKPVTTFAETEAEDENENDLELVGANELEVI